MKDPAIVFYTSDFMVGVSNLTMEERGQYITLLCLQHQLGHLNEKTIQLNIPNISEDVLNKFQLDEEGNYYNKRLQYEIEKRSKFIEHQKENGKKGGRPKKENPNKTQIETQIKPKKKPLENENENENIYYKDNKLNSIFIEYLSVRKKLKSVNSDRAIKMLLNKLEKYDDDTKYKMIEQSIIHSWKDVYELKEDKKVPNWYGKEIEEKGDLEKQKELERVLGAYGDM